MSFTTTLLQEGILNFSQVSGLQFGQNETRKSRYGALQCILDSTSDLIPEAQVKALRECSSQTSSIDVMVKQAAGVGTDRACCKGGALMSANVPLTYQGFCESFEISVFEHCGNRIKEQTAFNHGLAEALRNLYTRIDSAAVAHLEASKSNGLATTYPLALGAFQVPQAEKESYFNNVLTDLSINDYFGAYKNVASTSQTGLIRTDEFNAGKDCCLPDSSPFAEGRFIHSPSNRVTNAVGAQSTSYIFEKGQVGMISWINQISRRGETIGAESWDSLVDPVFGLPLELKICKECVDNSATFGAGAENDLVTKYALYLDVSFVNAYSSDANTGIYKYEVLA